MYLVPTLPGTKASGRAAARAWVARHPVQWAGTTTCGANSTSASNGGLRCVPHLVDFRSPTPYIRATPPLGGMHGSPALRDFYR
jgi:hypothetical protein